MSFISHEMWLNEDIHKYYAPSLKLINVHITNCAKETTMTNTEKVHLCQTRHEGIAGDCNNSIQMN